MRRGAAVCLAVSAVLVLAAAGCATGGKMQYSWQRPQATVLAQGDLQWDPHPFVYSPGDSIRYIDYADGNDDNPGTSKSAPWKHHPWDADATGKASACRGIHTYVFKQGVVYRGTLKADESGRPGQPIVLTRDPSWGKGEAALYGSDAITGGWKKADAQSAPGIPDPQKVWYKDIGTDYDPMSLWMVKGGAITRIPIARDPNWTVTTWDDVKSNWYVWQNTRKDQVPSGNGTATKVWGTDAEHLTAKDPAAYDGGTVWSEYAGVMGQPYANPIEAYDPARHAIRFAGPWGDASQYAPIAGCRYFIENLPQLLDSPGEYYYAAAGEHAGRLYVRLPGDADPNTVTVEAARRMTMVDIRSHNDIHLSGLTFRFQDVPQLYDRWWTLPDVDPSCVKALGRCEDIHVTDCRFDQIVRAFWVIAETPTGPGQAEPGAMDDIVFSDNDISHTDYGAIALVRGKGEFVHASVMRNRMRFIGQRPARAKQAPALAVEFAELQEVAGNILDRCYGAGVFLFGGKGSGAPGERPLSRILMHHNKVTNPLLTINDYGGIESWQGGPTYSFDNVSGNPGGYWHWKDVRATDPAKRNAETARFGHAYYMDGAFKQYYFNNIAWGKSNDLSSPLCNTAAFQEIIGYQNAIFNNTAYNFAAGSRRQAPQAGRNLYLGNVWDAISDLYFRHSDARPVAEENAADVAAGGGGRRGGSYAVDTDGYAGNVFHGAPRNFGAFEATGILYKTLDTFRAALEKYGPLAGTVGADSKEPPLRDVKAHDFRPTPGSPVSERGVKLFVPWGLYAVVGEWNFYDHPADPTKILDESWFMTDAFADRGMYRLLPHSDLTAENVTDKDFVDGTLEDWTRGALRLNGKDQVLRPARRGPEERHRDYQPRPARRSRDHDHDTRLEAPDGRHGHQQLPDRGRPEGRQGHHGRPHRQQVGGHGLRARRLPGRGRPAKAVRGRRAGVRPQQQRGHQRRPVAPRHRRGRPQRPDGHPLLRGRRAAGRRDLRHDAGEGDVALEHGGLHRRPGSGRRLPGGDHRLPARGPRHAIGRPHDHRRTLRLGVPRPVPDGLRRSEAARPSGRGSAGRAVRGRADRESGTGMAGRYAQGYLPCATAGLPRRAGPEASLHDALARRASPPWHS